MSLQNFLNNLNNFSDFAVENPNFKALTLMDPSSPMNRLYETQAAEAESALQAYREQLELQLAIEAAQREQEAHDRAMNTPAAEPSMNMFQELERLAKENPGMSQDELIALRNRMKGRTPPQAKPTPAQELEGLRQYYLKLGYSEEDAIKAAERATGLKSGASMSDDPRTSAIMEGMTDQQVESFGEDIKNVSERRGKATDYADTISQIAELLIGTGPMDSQLRTLYHQWASWMAPFNLKLSEDASKLDLVKALQNKVVNMRQKGGGSMSDKDLEAYKSLLSGVGSTDFSVAMMAELYAYESKYYTELESFLKNYRAAVSQGQKPFVDEATLTKRFRQDWMQRGEYMTGQQLQDRARLRFVDIMQRNHPEKFEAEIVKGNPIFNSDDVDSVDKILEAISNGIIKPRQNGMIRLFDQADGFLHDIPIADLFGAEPAT